MNRRRRRKRGEEEGVGMRGIEERCNNVWPESASRDLPPKKLRGMRGMQHEEEKKRKEERRGSGGAEGGGGSSQPS